ncbi:MAG: sigma-70 family RNA polymerase sigma factor [Cyanobacteriota bacterium]|nr:sigma-70 family RNA polymerase sigma factor [Cyanobacteriota bacterium]
MSTVLSTSPRPPAHRSSSKPRRHHPVIAARNDRIERYRLLVVPIARHYEASSPEPLEDLLQVGMLGLLRAAELYEDGRQTPFEAFAKPHIRGAILHYLRDQARPIRLPRRQMELEDRVRQVKRQLGADQPGPGATEHWCQRLGLSPVQWQRYLEAQQLCRPLPLDAIPGLEETLVSTGSTVRVRNCEVLSSLEKIRPRHRQAIQLVVLAGLSLRRAAERLKTSPSTVQRDLHKGLAELRQRLEPFSPRADRVPSGAPGC